MNFNIRKSLSPVLDLTPLIDVVFLLLIFFMVSTQLDESQAISVSLPEAKSSLPLELKAKRLIIDENGSVLLDGKALSNDWRNELKTILSDQDKHMPIQIAADERTPHYFVVHALDTFASLGFQQLQIVTREASEGL